MHEYEIFIEDINPCGGEQYSKKTVRSSKEKEWYGGSERKAGIFAKSVPLAECYEVPKRTGLPVAGQTTR